MNKVLITPRLSAPALLFCRKQCLNPQPFTTAAFLRAKSKTPDIDKEMEELGLSKIFGRPFLPSTDDPDASAQELLARAEPSSKAPPMHHLHVYSRRHNLHLTLTDSDRDPILSKSSGNIGFKKAARGSYDAAFQLAAYFLGQIQERGLLPKIKSLEIVLRGFGNGREAVTKALLGTEGRNIRSKITQVSDGTRLKFGGTRSPKPRRLG